ncbi:MAG: AMP-binding protein [Clostridiales bacterium]|nr:AMP-binding protein [Clostridiales bacterium]MCF8022985.1 AMP-binding protein [Clostridiales bacterium]
MKNYANLTVGRLLDVIAEKYPENEALVYKDLNLRYTYWQFKEECNTAAKGLMALGVKRGDHVVVWSTNVPEWAVMQFAAAKMGAVLVTANTHYRVFEIEYLLKHSDSVMLMLTSGTRENDFLEMINKVCSELSSSEPGNLCSQKLPSLKNVVYMGDEKHPGMYNWRDILKMGETVPDEDLKERQACLDVNDVANMQYTSGTTGFPKGVLLTHKNLVGNGISIGQCMNLGPEDRMCIPVPFFHCFGCVLGTLSCVSWGSTMVPLESFNPTRVLETVEAEKCTALHGVPTMFITELEILKNNYYDMSSLRTGIMAGSPCPREVMNAVVEKMGMNEIVITYGQTEAAPGITMTRTQDSLEARVSTVGKALPGIEVKISDPSTREELSCGQKGEICARGYNVMKGYYKMPEATAVAVDEDGWLHTGDLGIMDVYGYITVTGRLKDMIIRGGENIYPREIEEFLYTHRGIKDVQVIGVPSLKYGEEVMAFIQLREGTELTVEGIKEYCEGNIARYKIPRYIHFVNSYPTTANGKIQKYKLKEQAKEILGIEESGETETA